MSELSGYKCPTCKGNLRIDKNRVCPHAPHVCISELQSALTEAQEENKRYKLALEKIELRYSNRLCGGEKFMYEVARDALNGGKNE
jgi:hypothetical protein